MIVLKRPGGRAWVSIRVWWGLLAVWLLAGMVRAQVGPAMQMTTEERLETETWWPTMGTASLKAYAGSAACLGCHAGHGSGAATGMQRAATRGSEAHFLPGGAGASFVSGTVTYSLKDGRDGVELVAANGERKASQRVDWVMGAGELGRTFLYRADGQWFQSEASFYTRDKALDVTTGFGASRSTDPKEALGNVLTAGEARACFGCHTVRATTSAGLEPLHAEAGVGCEACHGPGVEHGRRMAAGQTTGDLAIFEPGRLTPAESIDFCGACHRSFADASLSTGPSADRAVVRFQPYRLEESRCWRETQDERLTCVACHDPHQPLVRGAASYDGRCLECHSGKQVGAAQHVGVVCPKVTHDCTSCHMPKVNLPSVHGEFTDHLIRVARAGEAMPR